MVQINFARKEINCKIVYYGPGLSGKTTNLEVVHQKTPETNKGDLTSISTDGDRTLFFDFMPLDLGTIAGMKTKFHLYTVPGQVYYNSTRKLVLLGADGIIFIADSTPGRIDDSAQSLENLRENMAEMGRDINKIPMVIQFNKRDVPNATSLADLQARLNPQGLPSFEACAKSGEGVFQTLKAIAALVLEDINSNERRLAPGQTAKRPAVPRPAAPVLPEAQSPGLLPQQDATSVLRPARPRPDAAPARHPAATSVATAPGRTAFARPRTEAPVQPVEPLTRPRIPAAAAQKSRPAAQPAVVRSEPAVRDRFAAAPRKAAAHSPAPVEVFEENRQPSSSRLIVFIGLGIVAAAAAAVIAAKLVLGM